MSLIANVIAITLLGEPQMGCMLMRGRFGFNHRRSGATAAGEAAD